MNAISAAPWLELVLDTYESLKTSPRRCPLALEDPFLHCELGSLNVDGFLLQFTVDDEEVPGS